jgi:hypothetical protein
MLEYWNIGLVTGELQQIRFQSAIIPVFQFSKLSMFVVSGVGAQLRVVEYWNIGTLE